MGVPDIDYTEKGFDGWGSSGRELAARWKKLILVAVVKDFVPAPVNADELFRAVPVSYVFAAVPIPGVTYGVGGQGEEQC